MKNQQKVFDRVFFFLRAPLATGGLSSGSVPWYGQSRQEDLLPTESQENSDILDSITAAMCGADQPLTVTKKKDETQLIKLTREVDWK